VPAKDFSNAATWNSSTGQLASVLGPGVGGALLAVFHQGTPVYAVYVLASLIDFALLAFVRPPKRQTERAREQTTFRSLFAGIRFLRQTPVLLAAITLDLFAVLLGGATTLMPIYALDILRVGPVGLGVLQAMPSIGAVCMAVILAHLPPFRHAGRTLLVVVAGFGAATVVFGISRSFALSIAMLIALGACDNISMVIRDTLMLTRTPNALMGRLSAIESIFVGTSNELGGFESGLSAQFLGPVVSVVAGGIGTILVVVAVAAVWPEMRHLGRLDLQAEQLATEQSPSEDIAAVGTAASD
jgi:MFS family permease